MRTLQLLFIIALFSGSPAGVFADPVPGPVDPCTDPGREPGSPYYSIDLVSTNNIPGTAEAGGKAVITFARSPFGISISDDGSFVHNLDIQIQNMAPPGDGVYVAWVTTPNLDNIEMLGVLNSRFQTSGSVKWNKYLVVITKEPTIDKLAERWKGPVVMRGMSKSGYMHTMAGHGPFSRDPCAKYGYY